MARNPSPALDRPWRRPGALRYALERVRGVAKPPITVTDPPADVVIERDVEVPTRDGTLLRINVFRSAEGGARPVIASIHPYGKDALPRRRGNRWTFSPQYRMLRQPKPLTFSALTGWEAPDPAWWTAQGFVVVNADSRGCGRSDGTGDLLSHQEAEDTYDLVGWLADQAWSDGRVVMLGCLIWPLASTPWPRCNRRRCGRSARGRVSPTPTATWPFPAASGSQGSPGCGRAGATSHTSDLRHGADARGSPAARRFLALASTRPVGDQGSDAGLR